MINLYICLIILNSILLVNLNNISKILNIYDIPDQKLKLHKKRTPLIGGILLFLNLISVLLFYFFYSGFMFNFEFKEILSFFLLIFGFFAVGLYDDKFNLAPEKKIILTILITFISLLLNDKLLINEFSLTFYSKRIFFEEISYFFTIFCVLILTNSFNFYDGINGQSLINFIFIFLILFFLSDLKYFYLTFIFIFMFLLFLNLSDKIFLGDSGIYLMSAFVSILLIYEHNTFKTFLYADSIFFIACLPGFDLVRLTITRMFNSQNAFYGDRNHIHHLLINKYSLFNSNLVLISLIVLPALMFFVFELSFFITIVIFTIIYSILIRYLLKT